MKKFLFGTVPDFAIVETRNFAKKYLICKYCAKVLRSTKQILPRSLLYDYLRKY